MRTLLSVLFICLLLTSCTTSVAQMPPPEKEPETIIAGQDKEPLSIRDIQSAKVEKMHVQHLKKYNGDDNILVLPGIVANRKEQWIRTWAATTELEIGETAEFLLIADNSGKDYESIAAAFCTAGNIHKALEFIGMKKGTPIDPEKMRWWSKGERVIVYFEWDDPKKGRQRIEAQELIKDQRESNPPLPRSWVFAGSRIHKWGHKLGEFYAADVNSPNAIISCYNDIETVIDIARLAPQDAVYDAYVMNGATWPGANRFLEVIIEPEYKDGKKRVVDIELHTFMDKPGSTSVADARYKLLGKDGKQLNAGMELKDMLAVFWKLTQNGHDPYVVFIPGDDVTIAVVAELAGFLQTIDKDDGIRVEPPREGDVFFKGFLPDESLRKREDRISQPWELLLESNEKKEVVARLTHIRQKWTPRITQPELITTDFQLANPKSLRTELDKSDEKIPAIYVFAPPELTYGQMMKWIHPVLHDHPWIYIYLPEKKVEAKKK